MIELEDRVRAKHYPGFWFVEAIRYTDRGPYAVLIRKSLPQHKWLDEPLRRVKEWVSNLTAADVRESDE